MNPYVKAFFHRGLIFAGFGPVIVSIVYAILEGTLQDFSLSGTQVLLAIVSTYLLAFVQAGTSVFHQIEHWPVAKSLLLHLITLYAAYSLCYVANSWIPFEPAVLLIFSGIFLVCYLIIWLTVFLTVKATQKRLNQRLG